MITWALLGCTPALPPLPDVTARERYLARGPIGTVGTRGPSLQPPIPATMERSAARPGLGGFAGGMASGRTVRDPLEQVSLLPLEGGGWALLDRDRVWWIVDPERGVVAVTEDRGEPTPDGRWLLPSGRRLDPAPMTGVRRLGDQVWGELHALVLPARKGELVPIAVGTSPDGRWVPRAAGGDLVLDETDGRSGPTFGGCLSEATVRWSPDSTRLTCRTERGLTAFDTGGRTLGEWVVSERSFDPQHEAWSPRNDRILLAGDGEVVGWGLSGSVWRTRVASAGARLKGTFTDDGTLVVVTDGRATAVLDPTDGARLDDVAANPTGSADHVATLTDGTVVVASVPYLSWWDPDGRPLGRIRGLPGPYVVDGRPCWTEGCPADATLDGSQIVAADGRTLAVDVGRGARITTRSPNGRWWVVAGGTDAVRVDLERMTIEPARKFWLAIDDDGHGWRRIPGGVETDGEQIAVDRPVEALTAYRDRVVVALAGGEIRQLPRVAPVPVAPRVPPEPQTLVRTLPSALGLAFAADGTLILGGWPPVGVSPDALVAGAWTVAEVSVPPPDPRVERSGDGWVRIHGSDRLDVAGLRGGRAAVSADGRRVAVLEKTAVWTWSSATGVERRWAVDGPAGVALSADGGRMAVATDAGGVELVDLGTGGIRVVAPGIRGYDVAFSPDGRWLALGPDLALVDVASGEVRFDRSADTFGSVAATALSPDGQRLAVLDGQGRLALWDLGSGSAVWRTPRLGTPSGLGFLADGSIEAAFHTGTARFAGAGELIAGRLVPGDPDALAVDDQGELRVHERRSGWSRWDGDGVPHPVPAVRRDPSWAELLSGLRPEWVVPGFSGTAPPSEPPCTADRSSVACSTVPATRHPVVLAGLEEISPSPGGTYVIGRRADDHQRVLRGPDGVEHPLKLPAGVELAWASTGSAVGAAPDGVWSIGVDGTVVRDAAGPLRVQRVVAGGGRMARVVGEAVLVGPVGTDTVDCVLPGPAMLAALSTNGRYLGWTSGRGVSLADVAECRMVWSVEVGKPSIARVVDPRVVVEGGEIRVLPN